MNTIAWAIQVMFQNSNIRTPLVFYFDHQVLHQQARPPEDRKFVKKHTREFLKTHVIWL